MLFIGQLDAYVLQADRNTRGRIVHVKWTDTQARAGVPFVIDMSSFPTAEADVVRIVQKGFADWDAVSTAFVTFSYQGKRSIPASSSDRQNVITYDATGQAIGAPAGAGVIAITRVNWNDQGEILDADIIFNGRDFSFSFSENNTPSGQVDFQDVFTHEAGHFMGLDHTPLMGSATVRPTMNPFNTAEAPREGRTLEQDDRSGVTALYPVSGAQVGGLSGQVLRRDGKGAFGVHVVVYKVDSNAFVASALSGSSGASLGVGGDGRYEILGLLPGDYHVAIEPHHRSISYENFGGIYHEPFDADFEAEYYNNASSQNNARVVRVEAGQTVANIDFALGPFAPGAPFIQQTSFPANTPDPNGPYRFSAHITDDQGVASVLLQYRLNGGTLQTRVMTRTGVDVYATELSGQRQGSVIEYRLFAADAEGHEATFPALDVPMLKLEVLVFSGSPVAYLAMRNARVLSVVDTGSGKEVARIQTGETPLSVLMTPDEQYLFVANTGSGQNKPDNRITVIETATHRVAATLVVGNAPLDLAASADGRLVYVTNSQSRSVSVIEVSHLSAGVSNMAVSTTGEGPFGIALSPDNQRLYVTDIDANQVLVLNAKTGAIQTRINAVSSPRSLVLSPDGLILYVAGFEGGISVINTQTQIHEQTIDTGSSSIFRLAVSPDGSRVYATDRLNARLLVIDAAQNRVTNFLPALTGGKETRDLFVSPDGTRIYVTNQDSGELVVFDAQTLQVLRTFRFGDSPRGVAVRNKPFVFSTSDDVVKRADFDQSGSVGFADFLLFTSYFGRSSTQTGFDARFDLDGDLKINFSDFLLFAGVFGRLVHS